MSEIDILFACDTNISRPWYRDRIPGVFEAIKDSNYSVELVDIYELLGKYKCPPTNTNVRNKFFQEVNFIQINKNFENNVISRKPKILILGTADNYIEFLMPRTVSNIRRAGVFVAGILGDDEFNYSEYRYLLGWFDVFIAYVKPCVKYYESFNLSKGYYLPNSCFLNKKEFMDHHQDTEFDVILVGAPIANRPDLMKKLISAGLNVAIYGSKKWNNYDFAKNYYYGFIPTEKFDEVLSKGKIVLAFLEDHITGDLHMNTKIWEAVRVARLPISTYYKRLEEDYGLEDGVNIVMYNDANDLTEKALYYVKNDDERIKIARALYDKVKNELDYSILYKNLFARLLSYVDRSRKHDKTIASKNLYQEITKKYKHVKCFESPSSEMDEQVLNHIQIIEVINSANNQIDYIYYDKVENGKRIITRWPFVSKHSIIFFSKENSRLQYMLLFFRSYLRGRSVHIREFCVTSENLTLCGKINYLLGIMIHSDFSKKIKNIYDCCKAYFLTIK